MKKMFRMALVAAMTLAMPVAAQAQLTNVLKKAASSTVSSVAGSSTTGSVVSSVISNLLGTSTVSESNLTGTWTYSEPCAVLESDNVLSNIGGTVITNSLTKQEKKVLEKAGFKAGKVILTLNSDKSGTITVGSRTLNCTWAVSGSNLTLTILTQSIKMNCSLSGNNLQLAMTADKLLTLVSACCNSASNLSSSFSTITNLLNKYDGLYLGLKFIK